MPGVYIEFIKAGKFVVPVELSFQTETIRANVTGKAPNDLNGFVSTSKWIERHNWKEIKAMLKPAVEACLKYHDVTTESIPKSHQICYGREVSLGYLIVPNRVSTPFLSILDPKKNCWTDDEDDEDELLGLKDSSSNNLDLEDHGAEFTECIPTKTAIRVCVVRKSVVSIDDARRIRKELGVRSDDVRHYLSSTTTSHEPGSSSMAQLQENVDREQRVSEWAAGNPMYSHLRDSDQVSGNEHGEHEPLPTNEQIPLSEDESSDDEVENIPRTFGDLEEIRDTARIYNHLLKGHEVDSGEDPDDDLSLPDIEPDPPKKKKEPMTRKKSSSASPSKSKRLSQNNILAVSQEGQANFSEEDATYTKKPTKRSKRKRTVAVVEPMRTLPNGPEQAIGALGVDKRRKPRPGSSHATDKPHTGGGRSKQTPAIDIIGPDDDRLTITTPPEPIPVITPEPIPSTSNSSPTKEFDDHSDFEARMQNTKKKTRRKFEMDDDEHGKWERLTPSPLFDDDDKDDDDLSDDDAFNSLTSDSDLEMPVLDKMVDSDEERKEQSQNTLELKANSEETPVKNSEPANEKSIEDKEETSAPGPEKQNNDLRSPDITQIKTVAQRKQLPPETNEPKEKGLVKSKNHPSIQKESQPKPSISKDTTAQPEQQNSETKAESVKTKVPVSTSEKEVSQQLSKSPPNEKTSQKKSLKSVPGKNVKQKLFPEKEPNNERSQVPIKTTNLQFKEIAKDVVVQRMENEEKLQLTPSKSTETRTRTQSPSLRSKSPMRSKNISTIITSQTATVENAKKLPSTNGRIEIAVEKRKVKRKFTKRIKRHRPPSVESVRAKEKPQTGDMGTQTEEVFIIADIEKKRTSTTPSLFNNAVIKVSRSCEASSEDELYDMVSQRSRTPASEISLSVTNTSIHHPALGSPNRDFYDDEGLFSFESPIVPILSSSRTTLEPVLTNSPEVQQNSTSSSIEEQDQEDSLEKLNECEIEEDSIGEKHQSAVEVDEIKDQDQVLNGQDSIQNQQEHPEISSDESIRPESPQPGCSYWSTPLRKSPSPPPLTSSILMPPPTSRPPRTPRKLPGPEKNAEDCSPPRLYISNPAHMLPHDFRDVPADADDMPIGAEAMDISNKSGIYHVLNQPEVFAAGLKLIEKVNTEPSSVNAIGRKLNLKESNSSKDNVSENQSKALVPVSSQRKRALSPDICDIVPDKRVRPVVSARQSRRDTFDDSRNLQKNEESASLAVALRKHTDDELSDIDSSALDYFQKTTNNVAEYQPQGDEFDLSQRSLCMPAVVPDYVVKSRLYKIHEKACKETPNKAIIQHFNAIREDLLGIFHGRVYSYRRQVFLQGFEGKRELRELYITAPFTCEQCNTVGTLVYDHIFPDLSTRCQYIDQVTLILVPEALIRIFSRINNVPYDMAETEMRFSACYDGELPDILRQNAISSPTPPPLELE